MKEPSGPRLYRPIVNGVEVGITLETSLQRVPKAGETWKNRHLSGPTMFNAKDVGYWNSGQVKKEDWTYVSGPSDAPAEPCALVFDGVSICTAGPNWTVGTREDHLRNPHYHKFVAPDAPSVVQPALPQPGETWMSGPNSDVKVSRPCVMEPPKADDCGKANHGMVFLGVWCPQCRVDDGWTRVSPAPAKLTDEQAEAIKTPRSSVNPREWNLGMPSHVAIMSGRQAGKSVAAREWQAAVSRADTMGSNTAGDVAGAWESRNRLRPHCNLGVACNVCVPPKDKTPWVDSLAWDWDLPDAT